MAGACVLDVADGEPLHLIRDAQRVVMASSAPQRRLDADCVLHVLDGFPVPLVIERSEVVHRALPLVVNVRVAPAAGLGAHEKFGKNRPAVGRLRGAGKHEAVGAATFVIHARRRRPRISDHVSRVGIRVVVERRDPVESR